MIMADDVADDMADDMADEVVVEMASRPGALRSVVLVGALALTVGCASVPPTPTLSELNAVVCPLLADQVGAEALETAIVDARGETFAALASVSCSYVFVDAGATAPAGHHIAARYRNHPLIPWIAERFGVDGARAIFERRGVNGDALDYLDATIVYFDEASPEIAAIFVETREDLRAALGR